MKVYVRDGELAQLIRASGPGRFFVTALLGTPYIEIDTKSANDIAVARALVAMRQADQDDKDRVGDPR